MALTKVSTDGVKNDAIDASKLPANSVGASELADNAVDTNAISNNAVTAGKLASGVQTTINDNAANRVITGDANANTLNGESSLTYDSGGMAITGNSDRDGLKVTQSGNNYGELMFNSNRSSANGALGIIRGEWNNTEVASIYLTAGDDTTNKDDGKIRFYTAPNSGSSIQTRMVIDQNGKIGIGTASPDDTLHVAGNIINTTSVSGTGDSGFQIANNHRLGFDQSGTRSWSVKATGGVLKIDSGDGNSAPQVRGILFGSDTADANKLNDYEEGTYTVSFTGSSGGSWTNQTYYTIAYTKIGDTVHIQGYVQVGGGSPSGNLEMSLPFVVDNSGAGHSRYSAIVVSMRGHGGTTSLPDIVFAPQPGSSKGEFVSTAANGTHNWVDSSDINTSWNMRIGGTYKTSA